MAGQPLPPCRRDDCQSGNVQTARSAPQTARARRKLRRRCPCMTVAIMLVRQLLQRAGARCAAARAACAARAGAPAQPGPAAKHSIVGARGAPRNRVLRLPQALPAPGARQRSLPYPGQLYPTLSWRTL